ncbi:MAG: dienelactone hydrolase family protein [Pseudomonadota bacterium]
MPQTVFEEIRHDGLHVRYTRPAGESRAGVLFLPSVNGLTPAVDELLAQLADVGLLALAWDPFTAYPDAVTREQRGKISASVFKDTELVREHRACVDMLEKDLGAAKIGVVGFCMGGRMALRLAADEPRIAAASSFYPTMREPKPAGATDLPSVAGSIRCPVQVHYPGLDYVTSPASFERLRVALEARDGSAPTVVYYHPKANHGFLGKTREESPEDYAAGLVSWPAALAFFRSTLVGGQ